MNIFQKIGSFIWGGLRRLISGDKFLEQLKKIAIPLVESVSKLDLNGDGRVSAANEIWAAIQISGHDWGKSFLGMGKEQAIKSLSEHYAKEDLLKWTAYARIAEAGVKQFGLDKTVMAAISKNKLINGLIENIILDGAKDVLDGIK